MFNTTWIFRDINSRRCNSGCDSVVVWGINYFLVSKTFPWSARSKCPMEEKLNERTCTIDCARNFSKFCGLHNDLERSGSRRGAIKCKYCEIQCPREFVELTAPRGASCARPVKCRCATVMVSDTLILEVPACRCDFQRGVKYLCGRNNQIAT